MENYALARLYELLSGKGGATTLSFPFCGTCTPTDICFTSKSGLCCLTLARQKANKNTANVGLVCQGASVHYFNIMYHINQACPTCGLLAAQHSSQRSHLWPYAIMAAALFCQAKPSVLY